MAPPARSRDRTEGRRSPEPELVLAGRAFVHGRLQPVEVGIDRDGLICQVARTVAGGRRHDVGERVLIPAATDPHVHFREPGGPEEAETIASGTVGAALGGVGLVGEMPNTVPTTSTPERLDDKAARVRDRAAIDLLLYAHPPTPRSVERLGRRAGGFKVYLSPTTGIDEVPVGEELPALLEALARVDLPVSVHAEEPLCFPAHASPVDPRGWDAARPATAEAAAVQRALAGPEALRLHLAHVTTAEVGRAVRARRVSFEVTAHHLLLSSGVGGDARWKVNPPLRKELERAALWEEYRTGRVPMLASDHAPHPSAAKALPFDVAPSGVPGVETTLPLLLARVASAELALPVLLATACDRPARHLGQRIGRLSPGHRAHLLVIDFRRRQRLRGDRLRSPCGWTPFEGWEAVFPVEHWRDGERIVDGGEYVGRPNGRVVRPEYAPGVVRGAPPVD
jgi:dihydroorotase